VGGLTGGRLSGDGCRTAFDDKDPRVAAAAVRLSEKFLRANPADGSGVPPAGVTEKAQDPAATAELAKRLVENGFAVFRYDKPGAGRSSPGQFATERSNALEAYTRAVEHPRIDPERVFLLGHNLGTDTIAAIYPRFAAIAKPAGTVLIDNAVGESDAVRIEAPTLIVNADADPDDRVQYGQFVAEARKKVEAHKLETELVIIEHSQTGLLSTNETGKDVFYTLDPRATDAVVRWLMQHRG